MARKLLVLAPLLASVSWITTIVTLFILWATTGFPKYKHTAPSVAFISHIGSKYQLFFIIGASLTALFFVITLVQFAAFNKRVNTTLTRTWADILAIILGLVSSAALVILTIYDSIHHETIHWVFTLVFAFAAIFCALFNLIGVSSLRHDVSRGKIARINFVLKILFVIGSFLLLVGMIALIYSCTINNILVLNNCNTAHSLSAIFEWCLALLFFIFTLSWIFDFL